MKNIFFLVLLALGCILPQTVSAQYPENGRWQFGVQRGCSAGLFVVEDHYHVKAGWRFDRKNYLGLETGYKRIDVTDDADPSNENGEVPLIPLWVDYTRYVPFRHYVDHSFFYGVVTGCEIYPNQLPLKDDHTLCTPMFQLKTGLDWRIYKRLGVYASVCIQASEVCGFGCDFGVRF